jgi:branched-chain amino acid aminotransferase
VTEVPAQPGTRPRYVMFDGELVEYDAARLHVLSPALKYGIAVFEGFCGYWNPGHGELYTFRMQDHLRRLRASLDLAALDLAGDVSSLQGDVHRLIAANGFRQDVHMRLQVFLASDNGQPEDTGPTCTSIAVVPVSPYFGRAALNLGVSTWARIGDRSMPPRMKSIANYHNGRLASIEAQRHGYDAPLMLTAQGRVSEGFGYNVFLVRDGMLITPSVTESILEGITRDSVIRLARAQLGRTVEERPVDRTELYSADEVFVCGSGEGITAVASVDGHRYGDGQAGELTRQLRDQYLAVARGEALSSWQWVSPVYRPAVASRAS